MAYSTVAEVKALLRITDAKYDTEIGVAISDADVKIDIKLMNLESVLPLNPIPNGIAKASKFLAAALWARLNPGSEGTEKRAEIYEKLGLEFLEEYITEKYHTGTVK